MRTNEQSLIRFFVFPELDNIELVCGKNVINEFPLHIHKTLNIGVIESGSACLSTFSGTWTLDEGDVFIINPKEPHAIKPLSVEKGYSYAVLCIEPCIVERVYDDFFSRGNNLPRFANLISGNSKLLLSIKELCFILQVNDFLNEKKSLLLNVIKELFCLCAVVYTEGDCDTNERKELMDNVRKVIEQKCMENLTLQELSEIVNLSPYHFLRTFKREIGISPYNYQLQYRIKNAQKMLEAETSISNVAQKAGFNDQSHFTRFFKKLVGITPGQYIKANKNEG